MGVTRDIKSLCDQIRQIAFAIHVYHGHGHLEKVYENAHVQRLRKAGLDVIQQHPIQVFDEDGTLIGEYFADLLIEGTVIVELKAAQAISEEHEAQLLNYLRATPYEVGLLLNFGPKPAFVRKAFDNDRKVSMTWIPN